MTKRFAASSDLFQFANHTAIMRLLCLICLFKNALVILIVRQLTVDFGFRHLGSPSFEPHFQPGVVREKEGGHCIHQVLLLLEVFY